MKIKDILESFGSLKPRMYIAYRIFNCSQEIKNGIKQWKMDKELPLIKIRVESPDGVGSVEISSYDLVGLYGFGELAALLMLDDIVKAKNNEDKTRLNDLLGFLVRGKHRLEMKVTSEILEQVKLNSPEVWKEYQKLCQQTVGREKELEKNYQRIIETEL